MLLCRFYQSAEPQSRNVLHPAHTKEDCLKGTAPINKHMAAITLPLSCSPRPAPLPPQQPGAGAQRSAINFNRKSSSSESSFCPGGAQAAACQNGPLRPTSPGVLKTCFRTETPLPEVIQQYQLLLPSSKTHHLPCFSNHNHQPSPFLYIAPASQWIRGVQI